MFRTLKDTRKAISMMDPEVAKVLAEMHATSKVDIPAAVTMRKEGKTLREIGERYGVSRERVRQLMRRVEFMSGVES